MSFVSIEFAIFFAVLISLYIGSPERLRKPLLLVAGVFFYAYWDWRFLGLVASCIIADYFLALRIHQISRQTTRRNYMWMSACLNFGLLGVFKYFNFFVSSANVILGHLGFHASHLNIILPIGISFFTFESMSYTFDVYRGTLAPCKSIFDFALFILFFPRLIAGPIVRASHFLPQIDRPLATNWANIQTGSAIFLSGIVKKILLADNLAPFVDQVFKMPQSYHPFTIWLAVIGYSLQIYYDFSGYSEMAIGLAKTLGFDLPINFSAPYGARNISDFWRRWHISLSSWLRDYVYIGLGGNRGGAARTYSNLMATMLLGGLWHGANWNFVVWGGLHGLGLAVYKWCSVRTMRVSLPPAISHALTLVFVTLLWVPFRARDWQTVMSMFSQLMGMNGGIQWFYPWVIVASVLCWSTTRSRCDGQADFLHFDSRTFLGRINIAVCILSLLCFSPLNSSPFVYFQF